MTLDATVLFNGIFIRCYLKEISSGKSFKDTEVFDEDNNLHTSLNYLNEKFRLGFNQEAICNHPMVHYMIFPHNLIKSSLNPLYWAVFFRETESIGCKVMGNWFMQLWRLRSSSKLRLTS